MAKTKQYTLTDIAREMGAPSNQALKSLKQNGHHPINELRTGKKTFRLYGQDTMNFAHERRRQIEANKSAAPALEGSTAPVIEMPAAQVASHPNELHTLMETLRDMRKADVAEFHNDLKYISSQIATLTDTVRRIAGDLGVRIDAEALDGAIGGPPDDAPPASPGH